MNRKLIVVLLTLCVGFVGLVMAPTSASARLTDRECHDYDTSNNRRLSVCARVWFSDEDYHYSRAVVEMHTYILVNGYPVADSKSTSITINYASYDAIGAGYLFFGNNESSTTCRINGPAGRVGCSQPATSRVAFYSAVRENIFQNFKTCVRMISFRDDQGIAHKWGVKDKSLFCYYEGR